MPSPDDEAEVDDFQLEVMPPLADEDQPAPLAAAGAYGQTHHGQTQPFLLEQDGDPSRAADAASAAPSPPVFPLSTPRQRRMAAPQSASAPVSPLHAVPPPMRAPHMPPMHPPGVPPMRAQGRPFLSDAGLRQQQQPGAPPFSGARDAAFGGPRDASFGGARDASFAEPRSASYSDARSFADVRSFAEPAPFTESRRTPFEPTSHPPAVFMPGALPSIARTRMVKTEEAPTFLSPWSAPGEHHPQPFGVFAGGSAPRGGGALKTR
jgi:hypothetical protein